MNQNTKPVFALKSAAVLCMGLAFSLPSWADNPLGLALSETLTYDTNILKDDRQKRGDTVSSTGVKVFLDKSYGRQQYTASVLGVFQRYKDIKEYDNDGYQLALGFASELAANGLVSVDHSRSRSLQDFGGLGLSRYRETVKTQSTDFNARYGLYGQWGLSGSLNQDTVEYERNIDANQKVVGARVGLRYTPSDLLYFDFGVKKSQVDYDNRLVFYEENGSPAVDFGDQVDRTDINVISRWIVTGYSSLNGQLGWTREVHDKDDARDFSGVTGRFSWSYTPRGKVSYSLAFSRDTNNAGGSTFFDRDSPNPLSRDVQKRLTTSLQGSANWQATSKISANAGFVWRKLDEERVVGRNENSLSGNYKSFSLGLTYVPKRYLSFDCGVSTYKRSDTALSLGYGGESLTCTAAFTID